MELAEVCNELTDHLGTFHSCERALAVPAQPRMREGLDISSPGRAHDLAAVSAWYLGWKDRAAEHMRKALAISPNDKRMQDNARFILGNGASRPLQTETALVRDGNTLRLTVPDLSALGYGATDEAAARTFLSGQEFARTGMSGPQMK